MQAYPLETVEVVDVHIGANVDDPLVGVLRQELLQVPLRRLVPRHRVLAGLGLVRIRVTVWAEIATLPHYSLGSTLRRSSQVVSQCAFKARARQADAVVS